MESGHDGCVNIASVVDRSVGFKIGYFRDGVRYDHGGIWFSIIGVLLIVCRKSGLF